MMEMLDSLVLCAKVGAGAAVMLVSCGAVLVALGAALGGVGALVNKMRHARKHRAMKKGMEAVRRARESERKLRVLKDE